MKPSYADEQDLSEDYSLISYILLEFFESERNSGILINNEAGEDITNQFFENNYVFYTHYNFKFL